MDYFFANSKIFRLHAIPMTVLDLRNLLDKNVLGFVMLHLISPVHAFLVT